MRDSFKTGFGFGITSAIITTLGLIVGLHSGTHSQLTVMGGILMIALADAFSDSLGIHVSQEFKNGGNPKEIWHSTASTFTSKLVFASTFLVPVLLFNLEKAVWISIAWGLSLLTAFSFLMAKRQKLNPWRVSAEHLAIAVLVIALTHLLGDWLSTRFG